MKSIFKNIALIILLGLSIVSCDKDNPNGNPENQNENSKTPKLLQIRSNAIGNTNNNWDLQFGSLVPNISTLSTFTNTRVSDPITSPAGLLSQTTMTWQSSAYDDVNKKYAVSLAETVVIYDLSGSSVPAPTSYVVAPAGSAGVNFIKSMQYVGGVLYVIQKDEIKTFSGGVLSSIGTGITLPTSGVSTNTFSNMTSKGLRIFFTLSGKLYTFNTSTSLLSSVPISGWLANVDYNGVEFCAATSKLYATKRYSASMSTPDDFVAIDLAGNETTMISGLPYAKDWSRISSAVDQATNIYYLSSSNGFSSGTNTISEINLTAGSIASYPTTSGYAFGLEYKN